jgi:hypothetical protein
LVKEILAIAVIAISLKLLMDLWAQLQLIRMTLVSIDRRLRHFELFAYGTSKDSGEGDDCCGLDHILEKRGERTRGLDPAWKEHKDSPEAVASDFKKIADFMERAFGASSEGSTEQPPDKSD